MAGEQQEHNAIRSYTGGAAPGPDFVCGTIAEREWIQLHSGQTGSLGRNDRARRPKQSFGGKDRAKIELREIEARLSTWAVS